MKTVSDDMTTSETYQLVSSLLEEIQNSGLAPLLLRVRELLKPETPEEIENDRLHPNDANIDLLFVLDLGPFEGTDEELAQRCFDWAEENL